MSSVEVVRRILLAIIIASGVLLWSSASMVAGETTTTSTIPLAPLDTSTTSSSTTSTSTTSTTTTLPSAVTTVPQGCEFAPLAQAVFIGTLATVDPVTAVFMVTQVRAGSLEGYIDNNNKVEVRYGSDVKYLAMGDSYIVGVATDKVTLKLSSTIRDKAELFGGAEVAGSNQRCPTFEAAARTLHINGGAIDSGIFVKFFDQPLRLLATFIVPPALVLLALLGLVWFRRGIRR